MADLFSNISTIGFVVAFIFAIISAVLFFTLDIRTVISDLSGKTARESIERMRKNNEKKASESNAGDDVFKPISTHKVESDSMPIDISNNEEEDGDVETDLLANNSEDNEETDILCDDGTEETELLVDENTEETEMLTDDDTEETDLLDDSVEETDLLVDEYTEETDLLYEDKKNDNSNFELIEEIMIIHTDEVI